MLLMATSRQCWLLVNAIRQLTQSVNVIVSVSAASSSGAGGGMCKQAC